MMKKGQEFLMSHIIEFLFLFIVFAFLLAFIILKKSDVQPRPNVMYGMLFFSILKKRKGFSMKLLITVILLMVMVLVLFFLWQRFQPSAMKTASSMLYTFLDAIFGFA